MNWSVLKPELPKGESGMSESLLAIMQTHHRCFNCNKRVSPEYLRKKIRCPYCGSKMLFKPRSVSTKVKAR